MAPWCRYLLLEAKLREFRCPSRTSESWTFLQIIPKSLRTSRQRRSERREFQDSFGPFLFPAAPRTALRTSQVVGVSGRTTAGNWSSPKDPTCTSPMLTEQTLTTCLPYQANFSILSFQWMGVASDSRWRPGTQSRYGKLAWMERTFMASCRVGEVCPPNVAVFGRRMGATTFS